jgi:DNA polymerase III epsilon subunit-like protein
MIFVDVETTGINSSKHGIISVGAVNFENPNNYFYGEGKPCQNVQIDESSFEITGFSLKKINKFNTNIKDILINFFSWCNQQKTSLILAACNPIFEIDFIKKECERCELPIDINPFFIQTFDLHTLAQTHFNIKNKFWYPSVMSRNFIMKYVNLPIEPYPNNALNGAVFEAEAAHRIMYNKYLFEDFKEYPVIFNKNN